MTPHERLYTAIAGGVPDRVPVVPKIWVDLAAALTGTDLRRVVEDPMAAMRVIVDAGMDLGVDGVRVFHFPPRLTEARDGALYEVNSRGRTLGVIDTGGGLATRLEDAADYRLDDPVTMSYHNFWDAPEPPVRSVADVARIAIPDGQLFDELGWGDRLRAVADEAVERTTLIGDCSSATFGFYIYLRGGMERAMLDVLDEPKLVHAGMEKGVAIAVAKGKYAIDQGLRILRLNDSVANMSVMSPTHWREFVFPHMKTVCDELHAYDSDVLIYCHICGNVLPVLEPLVETGVDCIAPLDPLGGFTPGDARAVVGDSVSLMGGVDTLSFVNEPPLAVLEESRRCIDEAGRNGGFVLGSGCVIPRTARRDCIEAHVMAAREFGTYTDGTLDIGQ